jgi:hypothetical protein
MEEMNQDKAFVRAIMNKLTLIGLNEEDKQQIISKVSAADPELKTLLARLIDEEQNTQLVIERILKYIL